MSTEPTSNAVEAEALACRIVELVGSHQQAQRRGGAIPRVVVNALGIAAARLFSEYAAGMPRRVDMVQALTDVLREEMQRVASAGTDVPRGPVH